MARFDLHQHRNHPNQYLLLIQSDFLDALATRMVIPVLSKSAAGPLLPNLHVPVMVNGKPHIALVHLMAAVTVQQCGKRIDNLEDHSSEIIAAVDFLFQGF